MDLQLRKIEFIKAFLDLEEEATISKFENLLYAELNQKSDPMTIDELNTRIDQSLNDSMQNRLTSQVELKEEIKSWG